MRLADLVAGLSRLADLGFGLPAGQSLRSAALAAVLGRQLGLPDADVQAGLFTALLFHVGCVGYAHETAALFGDEFVTQLAGEQTNPAEVGEVVDMLAGLVRGRPPREAARVAVTTVTRATQIGRAYSTASCEVGRDAARRLGLPAGVQHSVYHAAEWWNGKGAPDRLAGNDIPVGARLATLAATTVLFDTIGGVEVAVDAVRRRKGGILDPHLTEGLAERARPLFAEVDAADPYLLVLEVEPRPVAWVPDPQLVEVATVFGDLADLKTPFMYGHARGVATLARDAGRRLGVGAAELDELEVAGFLHDVGRVAISASVWEKPGPLSAHEWEQVRLHPYHSERILAGSQLLARLAPLVGAHHERSDGSGYHRGSPATELSMPARVLAAADVYQAMTQPRPHRPALAREQAQQQLAGDARTGALDAEAVSAVLAAAGHDTVVRRELPAALTDREVQVLRLVAEGCTNARIAERLVISRRTAEYHVQQIYRKIGVSSRAAAAMFAMEHHLLEHQDR